MVCQSCCQCKYFVEIASKNIGNIIDYSNRENDRDKCKERVRLACTEIEKD